MSFQTELAELLKKYDARIYLVEESLDERSMKVEFSYTDKNVFPICQYLTVEDVDSQELKIY